MRHFLRACPFAHRWVGSQRARGFLPMVYEADYWRLGMTTRRLAGRTGRTAIAMAAIWVLLGVASAQATVTVGSPLTASFPDTFQGTATEINFALGEPGS